MQHALRVGRSYLPLAKTALTAMEHWHRSLPAAALLTYYPDILPLLDAYLKSTTSLGNCQLSVFITQQCTLCHDDYYCYWTVNVVLVGVVVIRFSIH